VKAGGLVRVTYGLFETKRISSSLPGFPWPPPRPPPRPPPPFVTSGFSHPSASATSGFSHPAASAAAWTSCSKPRRKANISIKGLGSSDPSVSSPVISMSESCLSVICSSLRSNSVPKTGSVGQFLQHITSTSHFVTRIAPPSSSVPV